MEEYSDSAVYGISFEIGSVVQSVYYNNFNTYIYFNSEEEYEENIRECDEEERDYYHFEPWAEWNVTNAESELFDRLRDYLELNTLCECSAYSDHRDALPEGAAEWFEENETEFDDAFDEECYLIRMWMAEVLGELRREGFWKGLGKDDLLVIPFGGEDDIEADEMISAFEVMDAGAHNTEYTDYLRSSSS